MTKKRSRLSRLIFGDDTSIELEEESEKIFATAANAGGISLGSGLPVPICMKGRFSIAAVSMIQRKLALLFMVRTSREGRRKKEDTYSLSYMKSETESPSYSVGQGGEQEEEDYEEVSACRETIGGVTSVCILE